MTSRAPSIERALALLVALFAAAAAAAPLDAEQVRRQAQIVVENERYQGELQFEDAGGRTSPRGGSSSSPGWTPRLPSPRAPGGGGILLRVAIWLLLGVGLVLLLGWVVRALQERGLAPAPDPRGRPARASRDASTATAPTNLLAIADRLAEEARYSEALHSLLLVAIERLGRDRRVGEREHLTSREILALAQLEDDEREAFRGLVLGVEASLFGGREISLDAYRQSRAQARQLLGGDA